jgi:tetratricopeptide (TPR) repeat protein
MILDIIAVKHFIYISNLRRVLMKSQKPKKALTKNPSLKASKKTSVKKTADPIDLQTKFQKAYDYIHNGDPEFSKIGRRILFNIIKTNPNFISEEGDNPYYYLGLYYHDSGKQTKRAIEYFTKAIKLDPKDAESIQERGFCWMDLGEKKKALKDLKKAKLFEDEAGLHPDLDKYINDLSNSTK